MASKVSQAALEDARDAILSCLEAVKQIRGVLPAAWITAKWKADQAPMVDPDPIATFVRRTTQDLETLAERWNWGQEALTPLVRHHIKQSNIRAGNPPRFTRDGKRYETAHESVLYAAGRFLVWIVYKANDALLSGTPMGELLREGGLAHEQESVLDPWTHPANCIHKMLTCNQREARAMWDYLTKWMLESDPIAVTSDDIELEADIAIADITGDDDMPPDSGPPALTPEDWAILRALQKRDPVTMTQFEIAADARDPTVSERTVRNRLSTLTKRLHLVCQPLGPKQGYGLTSTGKRLVATPR